MTTILRTLTDEQLKSLSSGQVTNGGDFNLKYKEVTPVQGGLFDYKIFGAIDQCTCGRITHPHPRPCPNCGDKVITTQEAAKRFGYYEMTFPIVNFIKISDLLKRLAEFHPSFVLFSPAGNRGASAKLEELWNTRLDFTQVPSEFQIEENDPDLYVLRDGVTYKVTVAKYRPDDEGDYRNYGALGLKKLVSNYKLHPRHKESLNFILEYISQCVMIMPRTTREVSYRIENGEKKLNLPVLNAYYNSLIKLDQVIPQMIDELESVADQLTLIYTLNRHVDMLTETYSIVATSKENLIRNAFEMRVPKSGRANIVGCPELPIDTFYLPRSMVYESLKDEVKNLIRKRGIVNVNEEYEVPSQETLDAFEEMASHWVTLMVRNPTIHKNNVTAFKFKLWDEIAIGVPSLSTNLFNADFDGDQMAYYLVPPCVAEKTLLTMGVQKSWTWDKNDKPIFSPSSSFLQGLHIASSKRRYNGPMKSFETFEEIFKAYEEDHSIQVDEIFDFFGEEMTYGRWKLLHILGFDIADEELCGDDPINAKNVARIMLAINNREDKVEVLKKLLDFASEVVTYEGVTTMSIKDIFECDKDMTETFGPILSMDVPDSVKFTKINEILPSVIKAEVDGLQDRSVDKLIKGAGKLKFASIQAILSPRIDYSPRTGLKVYKESLATGMSEGAYVSHASENRAILGVKKHIIPDSGYLARQLIDISYDVIYTNEKSISKEGAIIKMRHALGRTTLDGKVITRSDVRANPNGLVRVKSCIDGIDDKVCSDEVTVDLTNNNLPKHNEGEAIGVAYSSLWAADITQSALALKHGGDIIKPSENKLISITGGRVTKIDNHFITVTDGTEEYMYPRPADLVLSEFTKGEPFSPNTPLGYSGSAKRVEQNLANIVSFLGSYSKVEGVKSDQFSFCYAPCDGKITYKIQANGKGNVYIGDVRIPYSNQEYYLFPDGYEVRQGQRICTGVLNLGAYHNVVQDYSWSFYVFMDQINYILHDRKDYLNGATAAKAELFEVVFKVISRNNFSIRRTHVNLGKLLNEMHHGAAKQAILRYINQDIGDGLLTSLLMNSGELN